MGFSSWIRGKALVTILAAIALYFIGSSLNLVPAPVQGFVSWMDQNTNSLLFSVCFLAGCYVVIRLRRKKEQEE
jgi:uncharacterized membrane protein